MRTYTVVTSGLTPDLLRTQVTRGLTPRDEYETYFGLTSDLFWTQVTRGLTPRDEYERVSREIRFGAYMGE